MRLTSQFIHYAMFQLRFVMIEVTAE